MIYINKRRCDEDSSSDTVEFSNFNSRDRKFDPYCEKVITIQYTIETIIQLYVSIFICIYRKTMTLR